MTELETQITRHILAGCKVVLTVRLQVGSIDVNCTISHIRLPESLLVEYKLPGEPERLSKKKITDVKPVLTPLSELTREHMIILAKLVGGIHNDSMDNEFQCNSNGRVVVTTPWDKRIEFFWKGGSSMFTVYDSYNHCEKRVHNVEKAYQKLIDWGYDLYNLIGRELAVSFPA